MKSYTLTRCLLNFIFLAFAAVEKKPRAIVHLGPHKTGTTHVQFILFNAKDYLESNNIVNFDKCESSHVSLSYYIGDLKVSENWKETIIKSNCWYDRKAVRYFFRENLEKGHDILISSEFLFSRPIVEFEVLMELLNGFKVTFVSVYRQWLLRQFSAENQIVKGTSRSCFLKDWLFKPSIYHYYYLNYSNPIELITGVPEEIIQNYDAKMVLIDYYGALDAGVDEVDVFLCSIFKLPCINNKSFLPEKIRNKNGQQNPSVDLKKYQIMHIFSSFVESKQCNLDLEKIIKEYTLSYHWTLPLPTVEYDLSFYKNSSWAQDNFVRNHFNLLFDNKNANLKALQELKYSEVDQKIVKESIEWKMELNKAFEYFQHLKLITC